jgi:hypothetical protein
MNASIETNGASPIVWLDHIWKSFGRLEVSQTFRYRCRGEVVCIIGLSDAGVSTAASVHQPSREG